MTINVVYLLYNFSIPANAKSAIGERLLARADEADRGISSPSRPPDRARYVSQGEPCCVAGRHSSQR
jgi:hypothetical protein